MKCRMKARGVVKFLFCMNPQTLHDTENGAGAASSYINQTLDTMQSICFSALVLAALLGACSSFMLPSLGPRQAIRPKAARHMFRSELPLPASRGAETACEATNGGDDDGIDYSADPITAFLGKFLPSGKEKSKTPEAKDLVRIFFLNLIPPHLPDTAATCPLDCFVSHFST